MKKPLMTLLILLVMVLLFTAGCFAGNTGPELISTDDAGTEYSSYRPGKDLTSETVNIGFLQFADIPALDSAREGIKKALTREGFTDGDNLTISYQNAYGDFEKCLAISEEFKESDVDLIIATATPAVQAAAAAAKETPVVFAAVTDPRRAGVIKSWDAPGTNVTGVSDLNPVAALLEMLLAIVPDAKKLGVIYNHNEVNSIVQVELSREIAGELGVVIVEAPVNDTGEVLNAVSELSRETDAIWLPSDNTVMTAFDSVARVIDERKTIVFGANIEFAELGAVCAIGFDYFELGLQAGLMVSEVLKGEDPAAMPVQIPTDIHIAVNMATAEKIGYKIPFQVLLVADEIFM